MSNPLLNELVLSNLCSYLPLEELLTSRLACKRWNSAANPYVRSRTNIEFLGYTLKNLKTFLAAVSQTNDFPFGRFGFQIWDSESFRSRFPSIPQESQQFFTACGVHIKYLRLGFNDFLETVTVAEFRKWFISSVPNLQTLELSGLSLRVVSAESIFKIEDAEKIDIFPNLNQLLISDTFGEVPENPGGQERFKSQVLLDLLRMCPYIQHLTVNTGELQSSLVPSIMSALQSHDSDLNSNSHSYLNKLCLQCILSEGDLRTLIDSHLKLSQLELHFLEIDVQKFTLEKLLSTQRASLKKLVLGERFSQAQPQPHYETIRLELPCMDKLTTLTVNRPYPSRKLAFIPKVYSNTFPSLTTLDLSNILVNMEDFFPSDFGNNTTIRKLRLQSSFADVVLMENIIKNFPNVSSLALDSPSDQILKVIWESGTDLVELQLTNLSFLDADSIFTGIPNKICEWIHEEDAYFRVNENFFQVVQRQKSLIQLTKLQRLKMEFQTSPESMYYVTDICGYLAIPQLKQLTSLSIVNSQISKECHQWISEKLPLIFLDIS